ncbi:MAG TPA: PAS domain-containing sensor histidine kinase, partial [Methylovirgula sp.]
MRQSIVPQQGSAIRKRSRRLIARLGPIAVALAFVVAAASFLIFTGYTPIPPTGGVVLVLLGINAFSILFLTGVVIAEGWALWVARRAQ